VNYSIDREEMYYKIIHLPDNIRSAYFTPVIHIPERLNLINNKFAITKKIERVIIVGMGGSAISGDIFKTAYSHHIPVEVYKDYCIPAISKHDLLIICSYSGNTEEALSCMEQGYDKAAFIVGITSNGILKKRLNGKHIWVELPGGYPPRAAIGLLFFSLLQIVEKFGVIPRREGDVRSTISSLMLKAGAVAGNVMTEFNITKQAAESIINKIPVIYASNPSLAPIAYRWKCQINENAKYPAFYHILPEMNHNEIEAWENKQFRKVFIPIFLSHIEEEFNYRKRLKFLRDLFSRENITYLDYYSEGSSYLERAFTLIYLGDMISYYLAITQGVDPTTIDYINKLKEAIS